MTPALLWTADAWAARARSGNPVFPYEWAVRYRGGGLFKRVCDGRVRTSRDVPLAGIVGLEVTGPGLGRLILPPPPGPILGLELVATVVGQFGADAALGIAGWRFGFRDAAGFWGIRLDAGGEWIQMAPVAPEVTDANLSRGNGPDGPDRV